MASQEMKDVDPLEQENMQATFKASLDSIFAEKLKQEKWRRKLEGKEVAVQFVLVVKGEDGKEEVPVKLVLKGSDVLVEPGKLEQKGLEMHAGFDTFFGIATGTMNAVVAALTGKLKVKGLGGNLKNMLLLQKLMVLD